MWNYPDMVWRCSFVTPLCLQHNPSHQIEEEGLCRFLYEFEFLVHKSLEQAPKLLQLLKFPSTTDTSEIIKKTQNP